MAKLWEKGFGLNKKIEKFTVGDDYLLDLNLVNYDIYGSMAHALMLKKIGILRDDELIKIRKGLKEVFELNKNKKFKIKLEDEDCHTAIENYLTEKYGDIGKKIHTGRSRNDQVLVDLRLYEKDSLLGVIKKVLELCQDIIKFSDDNKDAIMPGYTHMQKAMPSSVMLWSSSFVESFLDDVTMLKNAYALINQSPLGSAAGYGVNLNIDREFTSGILGFEKVQENVIYAANSRGKFESYILSCLVQVMLSLNKISNDLMLFTMSEFEFFTLPKEFCTGSSIMPQKKNYDVLELLRAKYHVVNSLQIQINGIVSNLITGFNRDYQLMKKPLYEAFENVQSCLEIASLIFQNLKVNNDKIKKAITKEIFATDEAYSLVKKGMPFRDAYKKISMNLDKIQVKNKRMEKLLNIAPLKSGIKAEYDKTLIEIIKFNSKLSKLIN